MFVSALGSVDIYFYDYLLNHEENYVQALRYAEPQLIADNLPSNYWSSFLLLGN
ncbi:MAG: hypothetical protein R3E32_23020 [Chitinophagales bacterium]